MKTFTAKPEDIQRAWHIVDAAGVSMGRLAVEVAKLLRGKHKTISTPNVDTGDFVIVVNASELLLTGRKASEPLYRHTGWPGGLKTDTRGAELAKRPEDALRRVVRGMLPHNRLGDAMIDKLKIHAGALPEHGYKAQKAEPWVSPRQK